MQLNSEQLQSLAETAVLAARKAGELISEYSNREVDVLHKAGGDSLASQVVTEVDQLAQDLILETLEPLRKEYDLALLTEELEDDGSRHRKSYFWCIDPMDGTLPFTRHQPGYAVSIALVSQQGLPLIGVVYDPVADDLYESIVGQGVRINGLEWTMPVKPCRANTRLRFYCDITFEDDPERQSLKYEMRTFAQEQGFLDAEIIIGGGAVLNACQALSNGPAVYFKKPKLKLGGGSFWDFAATACLFKEAGASVSDFRGNALNLNDSQHSFFNHCGVCYATDAKLVAPLMRHFDGD